MVFFFRLLNLLVICVCIVAHDLSPSLHITSIVARAHKRTAAIIYRAFHSRNIDLLFRVYLTYVRPLIEHDSVIWSKRLDLPSLELRRLHADLIFFVIRLCFRWLTYRSANFFETATLSTTRARLTWNSLPPAVLNCDSLSTFKSRLKTHLFSTAFC